MALNPAFEGRRFAPTLPYRVGREKIREFADAIGAADAAYRDPAAARALGHPDVIAPPTFPVVITMPVSRMIADDPDLGLDYSRVVHGDQRFAYARPVYAGDELTCAADVEKRVEPGRPGLGHAPGGDRDRGRRAGRHRRGPSSSARAEG